MDEFIAWVNSADETPAVLKAALAHLNLAAIHPFLDGNGRAARVVDSLMLYRGGFRDQDLVSLEAYFGRDNQGYYRALASALGPHYTPPKDCTPWVEYYLRAHVEQASLTLQEIGQMVAELDGLREAFTAEGLAVWQMVALWLACRRGRITNRSYRAVAQRSPQSAAADLAKLVGMRLLERVGRGRATRYAPTEEVLRTFDAIRNAHQGVDL
jgi:Fic family protein